MLLFKCKCGCHFTVKDDTIIMETQKKLTCQNCGSNFILECDRDLLINKSRFEASGMKVSVIPDEAEISVGFKI